MDPLRITTEELLDTVSMRMWRSWFVDHGLMVVNTKVSRTMVVEEMSRGELRREGLKGLARDVLGSEVVKPRRVQMGRWDNQWLNPENIMYACIDVILLFEMKRLVS